MRDLYKEKLIAFLEGLEIPNIDELLCHDVDFFRSVGKEIARRSRTIKTEVPLAYKIAIGIDEVLNKAFREEND
jgi:hypothetical protein